MSEFVDPFDAEPKSEEPDTAPATPLQPLTEEQEQQIRDKAGYHASETRTLAERDAAAKHMTGETAAVELPPDIEAVWGEGRLDATGLPAANTARILIEGWGLEVFRGSAIHQLALQETAKDARRQKEQQDLRSAPRRKDPNEDLAP